MTCNTSEVCRLLLECLGKLACACLYLVEQAHILDRDYRLVCKVATSSICLSPNGRLRNAST